MARGTSRAGASPSDMRAPHLDRLRTSRPTTREDIAEEPLGFHDSNVWLFGDGEQIVGGVSCDESARSPVIRHADLMDRLAADTKRPHARSDHGPRLDDAAHGHDREPASRLDPALGRELRGDLTEELRLQLREMGKR